MPAFHGKILLIDNDAEFLNEVQNDVQLIIEYPLLIQKTLPLGLKLFEKHKGSIRIVAVSSGLFASEESLLSFKDTIGETQILFLSHRENHKLRGHFNHERNLTEPKSYREVVAAVKTLIEKKT